MKQCTKCKIRTFDNTLNCSCGGKFTTIKTNKLTIDIFNYGGFKISLD